MVYHLLLLSLLTGAGVCAASQASYVTGGGEAASGSWPWIVSIQNTNGQHSCAGTIIHKNWVLTAGTCVHYLPPASIQIVAGVTDLTDSANIITRGVQTIYISPDYLFPPANDLALVFMEEALDFTDPSVSAIEFAPDDGYQYVGDACKVAGWGNTTTGPTSKLQEADMDVLSEDDCTNLHGSDMVRDNLDVCVLDQSHGMDSTVCGGDEGGPLVCERDGRSILVGNLAWFDEHCDVTKPAGFTRLSEYNYWISSVIRFSPITDPPPEQ